jgi:hypothetical protein
VAGTCEYGKELLGSIKMLGISWLAAKTVQLLKKDSAPWSKEVSTTLILIETRSTRRMPNIGNRW